jgi:uracil-DNA glycosylase
MPPEQPDPAQQLRQHIDSLLAAGVEFVSKSAPVEASAPAVQTSLFAAVAQPPPEVNDPEQRRHELIVLREKVAGCQRCSELWTTRKQTVFGVGPVDPDLCFLGEAPGADEDRLGEPFVGKAGQLLDRIIAACGMKREEVYILNILRCRPPGNRPPQADEAANCREYLEQQLDLVRPKYLCALGASAVKYLLGATESISRLRGRFLEFRGIPVMCTYHPSYLLREPSKKKDVWEDMKRLLTRMGRPIPGKVEG